MKAIYLAPIFLLALSAFSIVPVATASQSPASVYMWVYCDSWTSQSVRVSLSFYGHTITVTCLGGHSAERTYGWFTITQSAAMAGYINVGGLVQRTTSSFGPTSCEMRSGMYGPNIGSWGDWGIVTNLCV